VIEEGSMKKKRETGRSRVVRGEVRLLKDGYVMIRLGQLAFVAPAGQIRVMRLHRYEHVWKHNSITDEMRERLIPIYEMRKEGKREVPRRPKGDGEAGGREVVSGEGNRRQPKGHVPGGSTGPEGTATQTVADGVAQGV
jgi:hypothetical protein